MKEKFIGKTLEIFNKALKNSEIIVVDDNSEDKTSQNYKTKNKKKIKNIKLIQRKK